MDLATLVWFGLCVAACMPVGPNGPTDFASTPTMLRPIPSPTLTLMPTAKATVTVAATPSFTPGLPLTPTGWLESTALPLLGSFDVYLGAPDSNGRQVLVWLDINTSQPVTQIAVQTADGTAIRAGQFVYFHAYGTRRPQRVNSAGAIEPLSFANPPEGSSFYQLLPSANGDWLAWASVSREGDSLTVHASAWDGHDAHRVAVIPVEPGTTVRLIRLTNDGQKVFYALQPPQLADQTLFNARFDLYVLDTHSGVIAHLPGEPACGENLVCDAHISPDGAYLVRTLPPSSVAAPVVVTNLVSGAVIARFEPLDVPPSVTYELGYPFFTPGGELVYTEAIGPPDLAEYRLVWANVMTGEQRLIVNLGNDRHRPLGWTGGGFVLLTTREPGYYDTWQIDIRDGSIRRIAALLFLGHVEVPG